MNPKKLHAARPKLLRKKIAHDDILAMPELPAVNVQLPIRVFDPAKGRHVRAHGPFLLLRPGRPPKSMFQIYLEIIEQHLRFARARARTKAPLTDVAVENLRGKGDLLAVESEMRRLNRLGVRRTRRPEKPDEAR